MTGDLLHMRDNTIFIKPLKGRLHRLVNYPKIMLKLPFWWIKLNIILRITFQITANNKAHDFTIDPYYLIQRYQGMANPQL